VTPAGIMVDSHDIRLGLNERTDCIE
jgi:hypothetical protein